MKARNILSALVFAATGAFAQQSTLTTNTGAPVIDNQHSKTAGENGPVLLEDINLIEKLASFDRERVPERVVHARGAGAYGEFVCAADLSRYTKASLFSKPGKTTPVFVRFSTVIHGQGSPETIRDPRGFATKFYTDQGNYDLVGNNLPVFFIRDAIKFPDMVHALKPSPIYNRQDPDRVFDFFSNLPEATHMITRVYSDYGTPASYREMNGSGVHAYKWRNEAGEIIYVKYTWKSQQGVKNLTAAQAGLIQATDFQHATTDLYNNIKKGNFPSWMLYVQFLTNSEFDKLNFNPLDPTKIWPEDISPMVLAGKMTLKSIPDNFFQEVEQSAFSPGSLVPGIEPSEDKLLQGRLFAYFDTQRYRLGANFQQLPVNAPRVSVSTNNQEGLFATRKPNGDINYQPSSNPKSYKDNLTFLHSDTGQNRVTTIRWHISKLDDFQQAGEFYNSLDSAGKTNLIRNLASDLRLVQHRSTVLKMLQYFYNSDRDYGFRLAESLGFKKSDIEPATKEN